MDDDEEKTDVELEIGPVHHLTWFIFVAGCAFSAAGTIAYLKSDYQGFLFTIGWALIGSAIFINGIHHFVAKIEESRVSLSIAALGLFILFTTWQCSA